MNIIAAPANSKPIKLILDNRSLNKIMPESVAKATVPRLINGNTTLLPQLSVLRDFNVNKYDK